MKTFTVKQFTDYVAGWLDSEDYEDDAISLKGMKATLHNALASIGDGDDGIAAEVERREYLKSLKDK
jgi:hypothetical protein